MKKETLIKNFEEQKIDWGKYVLVNINNQVIISSNNLEIIHNQLVDDFLDLNNITSDHPLINYIDEEKLINDLLIDDYTIINLDEYQNDEDLDNELTI